MPSITIDVNGARIATIGLADLETLHVAVHGALDIEEKGRLHAMGGNYAQGACGHLIWVEERALRHGDSVHVGFEEHSVNGDRGKTIQELYPDEALSTRSDFTITDDRAAEIRARPRCHDAFKVGVETSSGHHATAASDDLHTDFTFSVLWDRYRPHQARVRCATYCFDDVLAGNGGTQHLHTTLSFGESASFSLDE